MEWTHKDHQSLASLPAQDTPQIPLFTWEHCPKVSGTLSGVVLWPVPWEICAVPTHPLGEQPFTNPQSKTPLKSCPFRHIEKQNWSVFQAFSRETRGGLISRRCLRLKLTRNLVLDKPGHISNSRSELASLTSEPLELFLLMLTMC